MEMNLYQLFVADGKQAVAFEMLGEIIVYNIFVKIVAVDKKLGIVSELKHDFSPFAPCHILYPGIGGISQRYVF